MAKRPTCPAICHMTQLRHSALFRGLLGINILYLSAKYTMIEPDSKRSIGAPPSPGALHAQPSVQSARARLKSYPGIRYLSTNDGIFELGLTLTKPRANWSPPSRVTWASYSTPRAAFSSSSRIPTCRPSAFHPQDAHTSVIMLGMKMVDRFRGQSDDTRSRGGEAGPSGHWEWRESTAAGRRPPPRVPPPFARLQYSDRTVVRQKKIHVNATVWRRHSMHSNTSPYNYGAASLRLKIACESTTESE